MLHAYDTGPTGSARELVVFWHGGTPNTGEPPEPLLAAASEAGARSIAVPEAGHIDVLLRGPELVPALRGVSGI